MKKKDLSKRLSLKKKQLANLSIVKGGGTDPYYTFYVTCTPSEDCNQTNDCNTDGCGGGGTRVDCGESGLYMCFPKTD